MTRSGCTGLPETREKRRRRLTSSSASTTTAREWHFNLVLNAPLSDEQSDALDWSDRFNDGRIGLAEAPGYSRFICIFTAESLTDAVAEALSFFEDLPGVLIRSVELDPIALANNGMATTAVVSAQSTPSGAA
ncbi:hypothetical protein ACFYXL_22940 [Streptomyces tsukubensis]|uniref:hypothetical protein n=1 Tax=Streptomyces tsukubensis TaxID=83656 RepID=UPI0036837F3A